MANARRNKKSSIFLNMSKYSFIPYGKQNIDKNDINAVLKVLKSDFLTQGPKVLEFEQKLAKYCGVKYAIACNSGTSALYLAYLVAGLKAGDEVITTPNTFVATSNMLLAIGVKPVFCDIRLDTYNIDEKKIEKLITKRTKAIVPVHFAGQACEMTAIHEIARKYKFLIIEDACHALGAKYRDAKIGACRYSDMVIFSFHPVKSIMTELGFNYRITDIQTALGVSQLKKLNGFIKKRQQIIKWYEQELKNVKQIILPLELMGDCSAWHIYVIRTANSADRDKLANFLKNKGIGVNFQKIS